MVENLIQLELGTYKIQINKNKFDIEQATITAKDIPELKAIISVEKVPYGLDRDGIWQDTLSRDTSGILRKMISVSTAPEAPAPLAHIHRNLIVNGRPGFDLLITNDELGLSAYRIGFWLEGDDVISIFASFPDGIGIEDEIMALANSINVNKSCV